MNKQFKSISIAATLIMLAIIGVIGWHKMDSASKLGTSEFINANLLCVEFKTVEEAHSFMKSEIHAVIPVGATVRQIADRRDCYDPRFIILSRNPPGQ
jgi:hypothetical protein